MTKTSTAVDLSLEQAWRLERLLALGFKAVHAEDLVDVLDIQHRAGKLLAEGCSHMYAYLLLREP